GLYLFSGLEPADYCVGFSELPAGYIVSPKDAGGDDEKDSDADNSSGLKTKRTTLTAGENDLSWDMGIYNGKASIGNRVWIDANRNGAQDGSEGGIKNVTAVLYKSDCHTELNTTKTDASGNYLFSNLDAGDYCIGFRDIPVGYGITEKNKSGVDDASDSDIDPNTKVAVSTTLDAGENDISWDMGIYKLAKIGDKVWYDDNKDGLQSRGENGVAGVRVKLLKNCTTEVSSTTTDANGLYLFNNVEPDNYCLEFSNLPADYMVTTKDIGANANDDIDSDVDSKTFKTSQITLNSGEDNRSLDMGIYSNKATIGDRVWYDTNKNGIQDAGESGVSNVKINLYQSDCNTTVAGVSPVVTDTNGNYRFE
ncbi:MAG: hypothetical protein KAU90_04035, partial [Sulfurovaceae bacterium]|nr:hypothetical protein [Sulfurovaceae bacterium]